MLSSDPILWQKGKNMVKTTGPQKWKRRADVSQHNYNWVAVSVSEEWAPSPEKRKMRGAVLTSARSIFVDGRRFLRRLQASLKMAAGNIHSHIISIFWNHASLFPCLKLSNLVTTWFTCQEFGRGFRSWNFVASSFFLWFSETPRPIWMTKLKCPCWLRWLKIQYLRTCFSALEENLNRHKGHLQFFNAADLRLVRHGFAHVSIASSKSTWSAQVML